MNYKVLYHEGADVSLKTKGTTGQLSIEGDDVVIRSESDVRIPLASIQRVEPLRMHGTGQMIKLTHSHGTMFLSVIRFSLFGVFAVVNYFGTKRLEDELRDAINSSSKPA